ncbi:hypothetical protein [Fibrobacter sp. UWB5]|uniref:hypothetical protein n=1 Tax=Fibrobacter sp. UWB5 TaxID=1964360 RepID=UPI000B51F868|nr:hypothetical protein [Fibrobacter sp. UWB5]
MRGDMLLMKALPFAVLSASLAMVACDSGSDSGDSRDNNPATPVDVVDDFSSSDSMNTASVETVEDLPNCTERRNGNLAVVLSEDAIYQCSAGRWAKVTVVPEKNSSSSITPSGTLSSSSSNETSLISSSSDKNPMTWSSSSESTGAAHCFEDWDGYAMDYQIATGYDNGSGTSGYWYSFGDDADGGMSTIVWPVPATESPDVLDAIIDFCGGVCGTFELAKGSLTYDPYAGVGFNIAGVDENGYPTTVDASAMGGISVTYSSSMGATLELGLGEEMDRSIGYDNPFVVLPKNTNGTVKEFKWSEFKQAGWGDVEITGEEAAKKLASIRFRVQGKDGSKGEFNIKAIKAYNPSDCNKYNLQKSSSSFAPKSSGSVKPKSSSSVPRSSSSRDVSDKVGKCGQFETWRGDYGMYRVETGCITEKENGGYWYSFDDYVDGGRSKIVWPVPKGTEWDDNALDPIIDYCAGVCGKFELNKGTMTFDPYVGVAFDLAGTDDKGRLVAVDASDMEGICIAYSADVGASLEISFGEKNDIEEFDYDVPFVTLAKSTSGTVKAFKWSQFKQAGWGRNAKITGEDAAKRIVSLHFKIQGKDGMTGSFNVMSVGALGGDCSGYVAVWADKNVKNW